MEGWKGGKGGKGVGWFRGGLKFFQEDFRRRTEPDRMGLFGRN